MCHWSCWPPTSVKEFRVESRNEVLCSGKLAGQVFRLLDILRSWFYEPNSCNSSYRKVIKPFMVTIVSHDQQKLHETSRNFLKKKKNHVLDYTYSPFTKITSILSFPLASVEQFLRAIRGVVSRVAVLTMAPQKFNSQLSRCAFF